MRESKSFQRFQSRFTYLKQHGQVVDVALNKMFNQLKNKRLNNNTLCANLNVSTEKYNNLNIPSTEYARLVNYSKKENSEYCFIELYNIFASYMKEILKEMYQLRPKSITSKSNKALNYSKIAEFSTYEEIVNFIIDDIFRSLENLRRTPKLVKSIINHTKIQIPQALSDSAMMYLSIRHLIVHNDSKIDQEFYDKYRNKLTISLNGKVPTDFSTFQIAMQSLYDYIKAIDNELILKGFINSRE